MINNDFFGLAGAVMLVCFAVGMVRAGTPGPTELRIAATAIGPLGPSVDVMRRDPSDIIRVGGLYYVWYTRGTTGVPHGYDATVWYATSPDGLEWTERGECVPRGPQGAWDEQSVFTPSILVAGGRYWLFYTAVPKPFTNDGNRVTKSAIGIAVADAPDGPWTKLDTNPVLPTSDDPAAFDSMRVDDACMVTREGRYWLYYKGRQWDGTPLETKLGVAVADHPEGPYVKHPANPVIPAGHEVMVWPQGRGVVALINYVGPAHLSRSMQYAPDGVTFSRVGPAHGVPNAAGFYRPEAFTDSGLGTWPEWGIQIQGQKGLLPGLSRFDCRWKTSD